MITIGYTCSAASSLPLALSPPVLSATLSHPPLPPRITALLPTRFASSSATSGATAYLDAHIRCVSAPVILGFHRAALIAIIVTPPRRLVPRNRPRLVVLRSIFPAKASLIDVTGYTTADHRFYHPRARATESVRISRIRKRKRNPERSLYRRVEIKILMKTIIYTPITHVEALASVFVIIAEPDRLMIH